MATQTVAPLDQETGESEVARRVHLCEVRASRTAETPTIRP